ncbi:MAG: SCO family protein [Terriglobia bacterium]
MNLMATTNHRRRLRLYIQRAGHGFAWRRWMVLFLGLLAVCGAPAARADNSKILPSLLQGIGIDQRLNEQVPLDLQFRDEAGKAVTLGDYFGKKPIILSLVYFSCPMLCTMAENGLLHSLEEVKFSVGNQFDVVTVSFDPHDTSELAAGKKAVYVGLYGRKGADRGWHFLTGDEASIEALTRAVGFRYKYDAQAKQYVHATGIMVLTPQGKVARYYYGIYYPSRDLRLGLVEASANKIGSPVDEVLLFCCRYDPQTGKYGVIISRIIQLSGLMTVLSIAALILALSRSRKTVSS